MGVGIIHFEDFGKAAQLFHDKWLVPRLQKLGGHVPVNWTFISYVRDPKLHDVRDEHEVAIDAYHWIRENAIDLLVLITDLDARGGATFDVEYGGRVLYELSCLLAEDQDQPPYIASFEDMLDSNQIMVIALTLVPDQIEKALSVVPGIVPANVLKVRRYRELSLDEAVRRALDDLSVPGPKVVLGGRVDDEAWIASMIVGWIQRHPIV
jgi:hypothetical protein